MLPRRRLSKPSGGSKHANEQSFKEGDERIKPGRPKGSQNKVSMDMKTAMMGAMELLGDVYMKKQKIDPETMGKLEAYWVDIFQRDYTMAVRMAEKILPATLVGPNNGPIQVLNIPIEALKGMPTHDLAVLERVLVRLGGGLVQQQLEATPVGDANSYAVELGLDDSDTKH